MDGDLNSFVAVEVLGVEFTSICNLQCVYCDVSAPGYRGRHTSTEVLDAALEIVHQAQPLWMNFTGIGELTTIPNWSEAVAPFLAVPGMVKALTTNLQKQMDEKEIEALVAFDHISISVDTADPALLREIRRKSELRNVTTNIARLRARAIRDGTRIPKLVFNAVLTDRSSQTLLDLAAFAIACGIDEILLIDLNEISFFVDKAIVRHIRHLSDERFAEFVRQLHESHRLLEAHGKHIALSGDLRRYVDRRTGGDLSGQVLQAGETRLCTQLWDYAVVKEDGRISHCCGNLLSGKSLRGHAFVEIMEDPEIRSWRASLLAGRDLPKPCVNCHWAPSGAPARLLELLLEARQKAQARGAVFSTASVPH